MEDILAKKNRHLFLEEKDNIHNSFISNINYAVENIDTIKTFNDNINSGTIQHLLEAYIEQVGVEGNAWVLRLTELGESILATTSGFNYAAVLTATVDIDAGATITLPEAMKYRVGTHMLLVSWNGIVCYRGDQYEELGAFNEKSTTIKIKQPIKISDKLEFRTVALADTASVTLALGDAIDNYPIVTNSANIGRVISERFSDVINVKDFGAKGDGETDDTTAIEAAATIAANQGKKLFLPDKYAVGSLVLPAGTQVVGSPEFIDLGTNNRSDSYVVVFSSGCIADFIILKMKENGVYRRGISLKNNCYIGTIKVYAEETPFNGEAVSFDGDNVSVDFIFTEMVTRGGNIGAYADVHPHNGNDESTFPGHTATGATHYTNLYLGGYALYGVNQGFRIGRARNVNIGSGIMTGPDNASITPRPGYNGFLITGSDHVSIGDVTLYGMLEHGIRFSCDTVDEPFEYRFTTHDIHFGKITSYKHGGSALKITGLFPLFIYNVTVDSLTSIDAGIRPQINTRRLSTLRLTCTNDVFIGSVTSHYSNPSVAPVQDELFETDTVEIDASSNVYIDSVTTDVCGRSVICFHEFNDTPSADVSNASANDQEKYKCENISIRSMTCNNGWNTYYAVKIYATTMKVTGIRILNVVCESENFTNFFATGDLASIVDGASVLNQNVSDVFLSCYEESGTKAYLSSLAYPQITISSTSARAGTNIVNASANLDLTFPTGTAGVYLASPFHPEDPVDVGPAGGIVFSRRNAPARPSGAIFGYQELSSSGRCGIGFAAGDGTTASNLLFLRWLVSSSNGDLLPVDTSSSSGGVPGIGNATHLVKEIFCSEGTINTSDERLKASIVAPSDALMRAWSKVRFKVFQFKDAIEKKGAEARLHVGLIAQQIITAFEEEGLDATRYGLLCHDLWEECQEMATVIDKPAVINEHGTVLEEEVAHTEVRTIPAGDLFSIRYGEALALECAYQRWLGEQRDAKIEALMQRISALENNQ